MKSSTLNTSAPGLHQALLARLRAEFEAPVDDLMARVEAVCKAAKASGLDRVPNDFGRLGQAAAKLQEIAAGLHHPIFVHSDFPDFQRRLCHDLRAQIGVMKGFAEMLVEDAEDGRNELPPPGLNGLIDATVRLLTRVDRLVDFASSPPATDAGSAPAPARVTADAIPARQLSLAASRNGASSRVLIVDDDAASRLILARRLAREGHRTVEAASGKSALEVASAEPIDLILLDMLLPDVDGYDVLTQLKADARLRHIPVIVISALDEIDSVVRCIEAGAEDYLSKPFNQVLLRARIHASLEKKQLRDREKMLNETIAASRIAHEQRLQEAFAATKPEISQLQETVLALRRQLDAAASAAQAGIEEARANAVAEIRQLRATCQALREMLETAIATQGAANTEPTAVL